MRAQGQEQCRCLILFHHFSQLLQVPSSRPWELPTGPASGKGSLWSPTLSHNTGL